MYLLFNININIKVCTCYRLQNQLQQIVSFDIVVDRFCINLAVANPIKIKLKLDHFVLHEVWHLKLLLTLYSACSIYDRISETFPNRRVELVNIDKLF